jgi:hypothetical protein
MKTLFTSLFFLLSFICNSQAIELQIFKLFGYTHSKDLTWEQALKLDMIEKDEVFFDPQIITIDLDSNLVRLIDSENKVRECQIVNKYPENLVDVDAWCDDKCINFVIYEADESTLLLMKSYKIVDSKLRGFWSPIWMWSYLER